jgi:uncharacterized integral membrane protein
MSTPTPLPNRPRPLPDPKHRKQTFWQIWVPLCVSILVVLFLAVLAAISAGNPAVTELSQLSTVYLVTPVLIIGFVVFVMLAAVIYGLSKLLNILPVYTRMVQGFFRQMAVFVRIWSDKTVQPVLAIRTWWAGFESARKHISH